MDAIAKLIADVITELTITVITYWVVRFITLDIGGKLATSSSFWNRKQYAEKKCSQFVISHYEREGHMFALSLLSVKQIYAEQWAQEYNEQAKTQGNLKIEPWYVTNVPYYVFFNFINSTGKFK